jgi:mono/diheme cytochrome c family protein
VAEIAIALSALISGQNSCLNLGHGFLPHLRAHSFERCADKDLEDSVKKQGTKLMTFRAFTIGFSAALLALACGSEDSNNDNDDDDREVVDVRENCDTNPFLVDCEQPGEEPTTVTPADPTPRDPAGPGPAPTNELELQKAAAENVLAANCGQCHGPQGTQQAGMDYINDIERLAETGKVVPLNAAGSRIIQRMTDGSMPPQQSGLPKVTQADINTVADYINNPLAWPEETVGQGLCEDQEYTFDNLYADVADDLQGLDAEDALTARYISLHNRYAAGVCADTTLDRDRQALVKMLNALSTDTRVTAPEVVDRDQLLFRINIEDYGWDQPVDVVDADGNIQSFNDKWEAIIAFNPYAVPFEGDDADDAVADSGTTVPVMFADTMLDTAVIGNLYYALIDVDVTQTLDAFILNDLDIDVAQNLLDEEQMRAGTTRSRISRQDRVIQRDDIGVRSGVLWQSFDFLDDQNESIFEDPFGFAEGGTEAIFTLPNGMLGFIIADEDGNIVEDSDILLDTNQNNFRAITSVSCATCHVGGFIPVVDEVREISTDNARTFDLDREEIEQLEAVYPSAEVFARQIEDDTNDFYRSALAKVDLPIQGADPVGLVFNRFDLDLGLATAAGDLGVTPEDLENNLQLLQPEVNTLRTGTIDRDDFTQFYVNSLCELSGNLDNQPAVAVCDQALIDLGL